MVVWQYITLDEMFIAMYILCYRCDREYKYVKWIFNGSYLLIFLYMGVQHQPHNEIELGNNHNNFQWTLTRLMRNEFKLESFSADNFAFFFLISFLCNTIPKSAHSELVLNIGLTNEQTKGGSQQWTSAFMIFYLKLCIKIRLITEVSWL